MHDQTTTPDTTRAQRMYRSYLAAWARDALILRRAGLDRPGFRDTRALAIRPTAGAERRAA